VFYCFKKKKKTGYVDSRGKRVAGGEGIGDLKLRDLAKLGFSN